MYGGGIYHPYQVQTKPAQIHQSHYPIHPDVKLKKLPFYEVSAELVKPSTLVPQGSQRQQDNTFVFHLTPQQATAIGMSRDMRPGSKIEFAVQVQLRFCLLETTSEQEDCFPPGIMVKVNNKMCPLPVGMRNGRLRSSFFFFCKSAFIELCRFRIRYPRTSPEWNRNGRPDL